MIETDAASGLPDPQSLLAWYDEHRRDLPWRAGPGERMPAYRVWLSEIMLQQTTVRAVAPYFARFITRFPDLASLARASLDDVLAAWAGLGYYSRGRNLHACAKAVVARHGGEFPQSEAELAALPGIGPYTAAAIASIAFEQPAIAVDGNVERIVTRLRRIADPLPAAKAVVRAAALELAPRDRHGDFAQALMDLGALICRPRQPACLLCPWRRSCAANAAGDQESFPRKAAKRSGKERRGAAFVVLRADGAVLVRKRAAQGLLGGMIEVPCTLFTSDFDDDGALAEAPSLSGANGDLEWRRVDGTVRHVFTHFPLELSVYVVHVSSKARAARGTRFLQRHDLADAAFPSLMRKVLAKAGVLAEPSRPQAASANSRRSAARSRSIGRRLPRSS